MRKNIFIIIDQLYCCHEELSITMQQYPATLGFRSGKKSDTISLIERAYYEFN